MHPGGVGKLLPHALGLIGVNTPVVYPEPVVKTVVAPGFKGPLAQLDGGIAKKGATRGPDAHGLGQTLVLRVYHYNHCGPLSGLNLSAVRHPARALGVPVGFGVAL